MVLEIDYS